MSNIAATIEARMTSTRLPGKVLKECCGKPMLELMIERVKRATFIQDIIIATTINDTDDPIIELAEKLGINYFRGSENDVLSRVLGAAKKFNVDTIVELTGDCPLIDPVIIDDVVEKFINSDSDYVSNTLERTFPRGMDTEVFSTKTLEYVSRLTDDPVDREHVSIYMIEHPEKFRQINVCASDSSIDENYRLTLDTTDDLKLITEIFQNLYHGNTEFSLLDIISFLKNNPDIALLNSHIQQKVYR